MSALVDIIIPNYNYHNYLKECLASLLQQPEVPLRVLILDDGSTLVPPNWINDIKGANLTITYLRHKFNRGHIYTYNQGFGFLEAPYYMLISPDDCLLPGMLSLLVKAVERYPEASFAFAPAYTGRVPEVPTGVLGVLGLTHCCGDRETLIPGEQFREILSSVWHNPVPTPAVVVRTQAQKLIGGYRYTHPSSGDLEMWLRLSEAGPVVYFPRPVAFYRQHPKSMQHGYRRCWYREYLHMARVYAGMKLSKGIATIAKELVWTTELHCSVPAPVVVRTLLGYAAQPSWKRFAKWLYRLSQRALLI